MLVLNYDASLYRKSTNALLLMNVIQIKIVDPEGYKTKNAWFFKQWGLHAVIQKLPAPGLDVIDEEETSIPPPLNIPPSSSTVDVRIIDK